MTQVNQMRTSLRDRILEYAKDKYETVPDYPWESYPRYAVLRHADNNKWYGLIMDVPRFKLGLEGEERVDILNVKMDDPIFAEMLMQRSGYLKGYHISKGNWVSILLDGTVAYEEICDMLDRSFVTTSSKKKI